MARADDASMESSEELVELLIVVGHRARIAFEQVCACDERVGCEVLLLKALGRLGPGTKRRVLAEALGWSPRRVTEVVDRLVAKEHVRRIRRPYLTETGADEAERAHALLWIVGQEIVAGLGDGEREGLLSSLRQVAHNSETLWRIRRSASE